MRGKGGGEYRRVQQHYARIVADEIHTFMSIESQRILDVGGHSGEFCRIFREEFGADLAVNMGPFRGYDKGIDWPDIVRGAAQALPFCNNQFDLVFCSEVLEHVQPQQCLQRCVNEMYRVTRKEGLCYVSVPPWYNPFAGHPAFPFTTSLQSCKKAYTVVL